jgi:hypothetical protein
MNRLSSLSITDTHTPVKHTRPQVPPREPHESAHSLQLTPTHLSNTHDHRYCRLHPEARGSPVTRSDKFAYIELKQLGLIGAETSRQRDSASPNGFSTPGSGVFNSGASLSGRRGDGVVTPRVALPPAQPQFDEPPWFHGVMDKETATALLSTEEDGTFLVRQRPGHDDLALAFKFKGMATHHRVTRNSDGV